jgi:hypothetical protein
LVKWLIQWRATANNLAAIGRCHFSHTTGNSLQTQYTRYGWCHAARSAKIPGADKQLHQARSRDDTMLMLSG